MNFLPFQEKWGNSSYNLLDLQGSAVYFNNSRSRSSSSKQILELTLIQASLNELYFTDKV